MVKNDIKEFNMIYADNIVSKSLFAGLSISIAGYIYLSTSNTILGAILFSIGLLSCVITDSPLFTGKSGFISDRYDFRRLLLVLILNLFAACLFGFISSLLDQNVQTAADQLVSIRLNTDLFSFTIKSLITGFLMTLAIESEKNNSNHLVLILAVLAFISAGCYHCIADMFYYSASSLVTNNFAPILFRLLITIMFNFIGCCLYTLFINKSFINKSIK